MNIFSSFYFILMNNKKELPISDTVVGKLNDKSFIKELHKSLDTFLEQVKIGYDSQDVQTEFIVNLCVGDEEE